jgi:phenylalanyl-tRNA synthetase beta chain
VYKFRQPVFVAELDLSAVLSGPEKTVHYRPLARYPSGVSDISLLLDRNIQLGEILRAVINKQSPIVGEQSWWGIRRVNIPSDKRSITVRIEYRSEERTLKDEEVEERHTQLTSSLLRSFSAEQR